MPLEEIIKQLLDEIDGMRAKTPLGINDRDRWIILCVLAMLFEPSHPIGGPLFQTLFKRWVDRGGKIKTATLYTLRAESKINQVTRRALDFQKVLRKLHEECWISPKKLAYIFDCDTRLIDAVLEGDWTRGAHRKKTADLQRMIDEREQEESDDLE